MPEEIFWDQLQARLADIVVKFEGFMGVAVIDLAANRRFAMHGDVVSATGSSIKIPILCALAARVAAGERTWTERHAVPSALKVGGSGVLQHLEHAVELSLRDLATLMIVVSDNTATNLCIDLAGGCEAVTRLMNEVGLRETRLRRKMMDWQAAARGEENVSTANELATLMALLQADAVVNAEVSRDVLAILRKPKNGPLNLALPNVPLANKPGGLDGVKVDAGLVELPRRPYAIACLTSLSSQEQGEQAIIQAARLVHGYLTTLSRTGAGGRLLNPEWLA